MKKLALLVLLLASCVDRDPPALPISSNPYLPKPPEPKESTVVAVPLSKPRPDQVARVVWKVSLPGSHPLATPAYAEGKLYLGGGFGSCEFYCLDAASG